MHDYITAVLWSHLTYLLSQKLLKVNSLYRWDYPKRGRKTSILKWGWSPLNVYPYTFVYPYTLNQGLCLQRKVASIVLSATKRHISSHFEKPFNLYVGWKNVNLYAYTEPYSYRKIMESLFLKNDISLHKVLFYPFIAPHHAK